MKLLIQLILFTSLSLPAQELPNAPLFQIMKQQSRLLYERGFNGCDMKYLESVCHKDLKSFYEKEEAQDRVKFFEDVQKFHCTSGAVKTVRIVDPGSLEVIPLKQKDSLYGAVQSGIINFYRREPGKPDVLTGTGGFTHVWLLEKDKWLLKEIMSFGYRKAEN